MKKLLALTASAALLLGQGAALAQSAPDTPAAAERSASPIGDSEGALSAPLIALIFAVVAAGVVIVVEESEDDPTSP